MFKGIHFNNNNNINILMVKIILKIAVAFGILCLLTHLFYTYVYNI